MEKEELQDIWALDLQKKMTCYWRLQENLRAAKKGMYTIHQSAPHWLEIVEEIKMLVLQERNTGRIFTTKMVRIEARKLANERGIQHIIGKEGWCDLFTKGEGLSVRAKHQFR